MKNNAVAEQMAMSGRVTGVPRSRKVTHCIGRGEKGDGCGYVSPFGLSVCPVCGGMLLTAAGIRRAAKLVKEWEREEE